MPLISPLMPVPTFSYMHLQRDILMFFNTKFKYLFKHFCLNCIKTNNNLNNNYNSFGAHCMHHNYMHCFYTEQ